MKTALEVFQDVISYESNHAKDFKTEIRVRPGKILRLGFTRNIALINAF
jgi:hypothetical protein